jgi:hypothetical protein
MARNPQSTREENTAEVATDPNVTSTVDAGTPTVATAAAPAAGGATAGATDNRKKMLNDPFASPPYSTQRPRADIIKEMWASGRFTRSQIRAELNKPEANPDRNEDGTVKEFPYQIVFATTKGLPGGPPKTAAAPATVGTSPAPAAADTTIGPQS